MKMPEKVRISVDLVKELKNSSDHKPKKVSDLAVKVDTTEAFLLQIVRLLGKEGIVNVVRGPGGGVMPGINDTDVLKICQTLGYFKNKISLEQGTTGSKTVEIKLRDFLSTIKL